MSDSYVRDEPADEVLDLYDVLPQRVDAPHDTAHPTEDDPVTSMIKGTGRNFAAIMGMFALSLAAFVACTALFSLGLGLLVLVVGLFILVGCLIVAGWSSRMTMALLAYAGIALPRTRYPAAGPGFGGKLRRLTYAQSWRDLLHVLVNFILSTITFSLALTWVFGGLGGVTYWFWSRWLPAVTRQRPGSAARLPRPFRRHHASIPCSAPCSCSQPRSCCADSSDCMARWRTHCWSMRRPLCGSRSAS